MVAIKSKKIGLVEKNQALWKIVVEYEHALKYIDGQIKDNGKKEPETVLKAINRRCQRAKKYHTEELEKVCLTHLEIDKRQKTL